jgi:hypothetical protein
MKCHPSVLGVRPCLSAQLAALPILPWNWGSSAKTFLMKVNYVSGEGEELQSQEGENVLPSTRWWDGCPRPRLRPDGPS